MEILDAILIVKQVIPLSLSLLFSARFIACWRRMHSWSHMRSCIQLCLCHLDYHANLLLPTLSRRRIKTGAFCRDDSNLVKVDCANLLKRGWKRNALFKHRGTNKTQKHAGLSKTIFFMGVYLQCFIKCTFLLHSDFLILVIFSI